MHWFKELITRIRIEQLQRVLRYVVLANGERVFVGRCLPSGSYVPARAFAAGESLWLAPEVVAELTRDADVLVCRDRSWLAAGGPDVIARVTVRPGAAAPIRLVESLAPGNYDILLDLDRDGAFDSGESIEGGRGPGIVVVGDPAEPGPFAIGRRELELGLADGVPTRGLFVYPTTGPRGLAIIGHGNGYSRVHTVPLGELLASWGIAAIVLDIPTSSPARIFMFEAAITRAIDTVGLDGRAAILIGHSASGGAAQAVALAREVAWPVPGVVLLSGAVGPRPFTATPLLAMIGNTTQYGAYGARGGSDDHIGTTTAALTTSPTTSIVVERAEHHDFTYPVGDAELVDATMNADIRRYVAGLACAFCRRELRGERALDVFLVEGRVAVPTVVARVAARVARALRHVIDDGGPAHHVREAGGGATVTSARAPVIDCNLVDPTGGVWLISDAAGGFVRWTLPAGFASDATACSLRVAQVVNLPGGVGTPLASTIDQLDRGVLDVVADGLRYYSITAVGGATVVEPGQRWRIRTEHGRSYTLVRDAAAWTIQCIPDRRWNAAGREQPLILAITDTAGRRGQLELRIPPYLTTPSTVSAYSSFRLPLAAFGVDPASVATVTLQTGGPAELAIDAVELTNDPL